MKIYKKCLIMLGVCLALVSCSDDKNDTPSESTKDSQKTAILSQYVNGVVVPTYRSLANEAIELSLACSELKENPTQENVEDACNAWIEARKYWELSEAFLYGAAGDYHIDPHIDSWPLKKSSLDAVLNNSSLIAELDEDGMQADGFSTLGYGLLGFHAVEYVLFRDGNARNISDISEGELIFNAAVAEDLAAQTILLEASWAGTENITKEKLSILEELELLPSKNYGEEMINAGLAGNAQYKTQLDAMIQILQGASDIADEVGNTKIEDPISSGNVLDVESWYSWNSIADFTDNIRSVRNAYYGSTDGTVNSNSLSSYMKKYYPSVDTNVREAIESCITTVAAMPAPFRNHLNRADNAAAQAACNKCMDAIDSAIETLQN